MKRRYRPAGMEKQGASTFMEWMTTILLNICFLLVITAILFVLLT